MYRCRNHCRMSLLTFWDIFYLKPLTFIIYGLVPLGEVGCFWCEILQISDSPNCTTQYSFLFLPTTAFKDIQRTVVIKMHKHTSRLRAQWECQDGFFPSPPNKILNWHAHRWHMCGFQDDGKKRGARWNIQNSRWKGQSSRCDVRGAPCEAEATHQRELYFGGKGFLVAEGLDHYDHRRGHGLGQLVGAYGVVLQRKVREDHEATEAEGQEEELGRRQTLGGKDVQLLAEVQAQPGDHKVHQGQAHVGEAVVHIDPFVEEHDADGHQQVEKEPGGDAPIAPHSLRQRGHDPHGAGALPPPRRTPGLPSAALALFLRVRAPAAAASASGRLAGHGRATAEYTCSATAQRARDDAAARPARPAPCHVTRGAGDSAPSWEPSCGYPAQAHWALGAQSCFLLSLFPLSRLTWTLRGPSEFLLMSGIFCVSVDSTC